MAGKHFGGWGPSLVTGECFCCVTSSGSKTESGCKQLVTSRWTWGWEHRVQAYRLQVISKKLGHGTGRPDRQAGTRCCSSLGSLLAAAASEDFGPSPWLDTRSHHWVSDPGMWGHCEGLTQTVPRCCCLKTNVSPTFSNPDFKSRWCCDEWNPNFNVLLTYPHSIDGLPRWR